MKRYLIVFLISLLFSGVALAAQFGGSISIVTTAPPTPDFSITVLPSTMSIAAGSNNSANPATVIVSSIGGFNSAVTLTSSCVAPIACTFGTGSITPPANGALNTTLTVSVAGGASAGITNETLTGTSGSTTHTGAFSVTVPSTGCTFSTPTTNASCIPSADSTDYLSDGSGYSWKFEAGNNNRIDVYQSATPSGSPWYNTFARFSQATICNGLTNPASGNFLVGQATNNWATATDYWLFDTNQVYQTTQPSTVSGVTCPGGFNYFARNGSFIYDRLDQACNAATTANDTIEAKAPPAGMTEWELDLPFFGSGGCGLIANGVTLTLDSGFNAYGGSCDGGVGAICIGVSPANGGPGPVSNVTISAADATLQYYAANITAAVEIESLSTNPTVGGTVGHPFIIDCKQATTQGTDGLNSSGGNGLVTLNYITIQNCGAGSGGGFAHSSYLGFSSRNATLTSDYCHASMGLTIINSAGDSPAAKFDDPCVSGQGVVTNFAVYCTLSPCDSTTLTSGAQNQPYDQQCGGNHLVQKSLLEYVGPAGAATDIGIFAKVGWGQIGAHGCMTLPTTGPNQIIIDKTISIMDGHSGFGNYVGGRPIIICGSAYDGNDCNAGAASWSTSSSTSLSVATGYKSLVVGTGVVTGTGNTPGGGIPVTLTSGGNTLTALTDIAAPYDGSNYSITASISGTTMTVTNVSICENLAYGPCVIAPGQTLFHSDNNDVASHTHIVQQLTGTTGGIGTYQVSVSQNIASENMGTIPYDTGDGTMAINVYAVSGSGSASSWTVAAANHESGCAKNGQIVEDDDNFSFAHRFWAGPGVATDTGCTGSGADTNDYFLGTTGVAAASTTISSASYNSGTGVLGITLAGSIGATTNTVVCINKVTGTGSSDKAHGCFQAASGTSGTTLNLQLATGLTLTVTGGSVSTGAGRGQACLVETNWSSGSGTNCAYPYVPAFLP